VDALTMGGIAQDAGLAALFSNLRRLRRPSEDSAIPDKGEIGRRHGSHTWLRIPGEGVSLILAQRAAWETDCMFQGWYTSIIQESLTVFL